MPLEHGEHWVDERSEAELAIVKQLKKWMFQYMQDMQKDPTLEKPVFESEEEAEKYNNNLLEWELFCLLDEVSDRELAKSVENYYKFIRQYRNVKDSVKLCKEKLKKKEK